MRQRAGELGVSVSYWDWRGHEVPVSGETLEAIVACLEGVPAAVGAEGDSAVPDSAVPEAVAPGPGERSWGFAVQLYSLRSRASWGHGDLRDLAELAAWSARELGAGFVLINPLHAVEPLPPVSASPYLPMSRRWVSPLYLRIEDIPEYKELTYPERRRLTELSAPLRAASGTPALIDRDTVWSAKREALEMLRKVHRSDERQASLEEFCAGHGRDLEDWAAWCALAEVHGPDYRTWPARLRDPRSAAVAAELRGGDLAAQAEFHSWVQWLVAEQATAAQAAARDAGMAIGIIADLAIGVHPGGADAWALRDCFARGFTVGAPPDAFNQRGQDWGLPPMHPRALAAAAYRPLADLVGASLALGGGLRIDHVMGLSRLWWIPAGAPPTEGAYVYYDAAGTLGTLAATAAVSGSVVVGEDLGTVEPWLRDALAERGVLGTQLLWFERGWSGEPLAPQWWRRNSMVTVSTHDLPPAARVPFRVPGHRPPRPRPAHPPGVRGAGGGIPHGRRLDRRPRRAGPACAGPPPHSRRVHRRALRLPGTDPRPAHRRQPRRGRRRNALTEHAGHLDRVPQLETPPLRPRRRPCPPRGPPGERARPRRSPSGSRPRPIRLAAALEEQYQCRINAAAPDSVMGHVHGASAQPLREFVTLNFAPRHVADHEPWKDRTT